MKTLTPFEKKSRVIQLFSRYTPLMIAALHQRTEAYKLLVDLYGADPEVRDYSGKKARNYFEPAWAPKEDLYQQYPGELEDLYNRYLCVS